MDFSNLSFTLKHLKLEVHCDVRANQASVGTVGTVGTVKDRQVNSPTDRHTAHTADRPIEQSTDGERDRLTEH